MEERVELPRQADPVAPRDDAELVARLRRGEAAAFAEVVDRWSSMMLRVARTYVSTDASAQEIVQDTWMAVVRGLDRFEGRSSLRTWVFRILTNLAKTRGVREARTVPWSSLGPTEDDQPTVDPDRFAGPGERAGAHWTSLGSPRRWQPSPEDSSLAGEIRVRLAAALAVLPDRQRVVVTLRDVHGVPADEVSATLGITDANQRVLLHRARARLRAELEDYYRGVGSVVTS
ncbi:MAG TPA: sigma-70 family RNA polymerase sigma factor [Jiangellales bacterium]|nr:sigma-70 family RNA polymerase sigma factor [Jiangellales bacterium]